MNGTEPDSTATAENATPAWEQQRRAAIAEAERVLAVAADGMMEPLYILMAAVDALAHERNAVRGALVTRTSRTKAAAIERDGDADVPNRVRGIGDRLREVSPLWVALLKLVAERAVMPAQVNRWTERKTVVMETWVYPGGHVRVVRHVNVGNLYGPDGAGWVVLSAPADKFGEAGTDASWELLPEQSPHPAFRLGADAVVRYLSGLRTGSGSTR